jgi:histidinol-phosphate aminotransferase
MSVYGNDRTRRLSPYIPGEQPQGQRLVKLNTNENPYPPASGVIEAIRRAACETLRLYPDPECRELRERIAAAYRVRPGQVFAGNGSDEVLAFAFGAFFESREPPILFPDISYSFYPVYAGLWSIPYQTVALAEDFSIPAGGFLTPAGGAILPNPNAPTGMALSQAELLTLADYHGGQNRVVVVDEAYGAFTGGPLPGARSMVSYIEEFPNLLTVHTLSKMGSLAGLRVGFAIGNEALIQGLCRVRDSFNSYPVDRLAQAGAAAALEDIPYYEGISRRIIATRERVSAALKALGFEVLPSEANFIFIRKPGVPGAALFQTLRDRGVLVRRFNKPRIEDFLRVSIGTDEDMDRFLGVFACLQPT